ncbi:Essential protein Yae1, N terminal [Fusarium torreyae]|uniref:Protein YAE1 n=1 Tax=Fusarium torreyae TaxID=1237075 RepID=A0A9W8S029_9HYPO|nr:Essential protein Yae1, N terminal [Fusarium torreyae]
MHFQPVEQMIDEAYAARPQDEHEVEPPSTNDALDDVFGSGPSSPTAEHGHRDENDASGAAHPSDIRRLQTEHTTAGYREGITVSKESSLQAGFDEGFSLGASIGLRAGQLLGLLEGIAEAVRGRDDANSSKVLKLTTKAREELSTENIFKPDYWAEDGNWKYEVKPAAGTEEVLFADVADAHPLVKKWSSVVEEQVELWKIDRNVLDDETGLRLEAVVDEPLGSGAAPTAKKPLDW